MIPILLAIPTQILVSSDWGCFGILLATMTCSGLGQVATLLLQGVVGEETTTPSSRLRRRLHLLKQLHI